MTMTLDLPDKLDEQLEASVDQGYYSSKSEAIRTAIRELFKGEQING